MAWSRDLVYCVALLLLIVCLTQATSSCYYCRNGRSNEECNAGPIQTCGQWTYRSVLDQRSDYACEVEVYAVTGFKIIKKQCIDGSQCYNPNVKQCDWNGIRCQYCCFGDRCNEHEIPPEPSTTTTMPTSTTQHHTSPGATTHSMSITTSPTTTSYHTYPTTQHPTGPGIPGPQGPMGPTGPVGERGDYGVTGFKGQPGENGLDGGDGQKGSPGDRFPGPKGHAGWPGPEGAKGVAGEDNPDDLAKLKGDKGDGGFPGVHGLDGQQGETGECECPEPSKDPAVSFTVTASEVEQTSDYYEHVPIKTVIANITNIGDGISAEYMDFTAPVDGIYVFYVTSIANGNGAVPLVLFRDSAEVIVMTGRSDKSATGVYPIGNAHTTLELLKGQLVSVVIREKRQGFFWGLVDIYSPSDVTFSGFLLSPLTAKTSVFTY